MASKLPCRCATAAHGARPHVKETEMRIATLIAGVVLLGTITFAQSINFDFDKNANFRSFRTYAWVPGASVPDALNNERIVNALNAQLALKGLTKVDRQANPDLYVAYHAA